MKIPINLASQPFRRDRAMMVAMGTVAALLVVSLAVLIELAQAGPAAARRPAARDRRAQCQPAPGFLRRAAAGGDAPPAAECHRARAQRVYQRFDFHKSVSWSRLFADLEKTVPYNVRVMTLHPTVDSRNEVMLDMTVGAEKPEALDGLPEGA